MRRFMMFMAMAFCLAFAMTAVAAPVDTAVEAVTSVADPSDQDSAGAGGSVAAVAAADESVIASADSATEVTGETKIPDIEEDLGKFLTVMLEAFRAGEWGLGLTMLGMLLLWALRRYGARVVPALATEGASVIVTLLFSAVGVLAQQLYNGDSVTFGVVWDALKIGITAIGGFVVLKELAMPLLTKLYQKVFGAKQAAEA